MKLALVPLVLLATVATARAQTPSDPTNATIIVGTPITAGVPITIRWTPSSMATATYDIVGSYNTGASPFTGSAAAGASAYTRVMPYPAAAMNMWACVRARSPSGVLSADNTCNQATIPAMAPVATTTTVVVEYNEPTTSDCTGKPQPCSTILTDLAYTSIYYQLGLGPTIIGPIVAASSPTGGAHRVIAFEVGATTGPMTVWVTATDVNDEQSASSAPWTIRLDAPGRGTVSVTTITR